MATARKPRTPRPSTRRPTVKTLSLIDALVNVAPRAVVLDSELVPVAMTPLAERELHGDFGEALSREFGLQRIEVEGSSLEELVPNPEALRFYRRRAESESFVDKVTIGPSVVEFRVSSLASEGGAFGYVVTWKM